MSDGYNWIRSKDCNGLIEMEKGKLKRELISAFLDDYNKVLYIISDQYQDTMSDPWYAISREDEKEIKEIKEKWEGKLK